ncbi:MAG: ABC transporter substrate-binding protein [Pseudodesulfovibrio sp.]
MKGLAAWIVFGLAVVVCLSWIGFGVRDDLREDHVFHYVIQKRIDLAEGAGKEIHIGLAGDWKEHCDVLRGAELAAAMLNENGGVLGRKVVIEQRDDRGTVEGALAVAQAFASRPEVPFVVGHTRLPLLAAVAQNYEFYGVLVLAPVSSGMGSTVNAFSLLFENGIPAVQTSRAALDLARRKGWKRLGLIYSKSDHGRRQAREFESVANQQGIRVALSFGYEGRGSGVSLHMARWKRELALDAMVLAVRDRDELPLISACRAVGIDCPFVVIGERPADFTPENRHLLGQLYFLERQEPPGYDAFARRYAARFQADPSADSVCGYDAVHLLAGAVRKAGSFVPADVAKALSDGVADSLSGTIRFDEHGSAVKAPPRFIAR